MSGCVGGIGDIDDVFNEIVEKLLNEVRRVYSETNTRKILSYYFTQIRNCSRRHHLLCFRKNLCNTKDSRLFKGSLRKAINKSLHLTK